MSKTIDEKDRFLVLQDSREKLPWEFKPDEYCIGSKVGKLDTADYTIENFENEIVIERKKSVSEISNNIFEKRFERELQRLEEFPYPYMIFEFTWNDIIIFPVNSNVPRHLWHKLTVSAELLEKAITRYMLKYKTKIIFAGKHGQRMTYDLFKYFVRMKNGKL